MVHNDPDVREGILRIVREGGGIGGNHAVTFANNNWPEFAEIHPFAPIKQTRGYQKLFVEAQQRVEHRHYRSRVDLMVHEKQRQEILKDLGADPYVD